MKKLHFLIDLRMPVTMATIQVSFNNNFSLVSKPATSISIKILDMLVHAQQNATLWLDL